MNLQLIAGTANESLAQEVAGRVGVVLSTLTIERFPDEESYVRIDTGCRGNDVYILESTSPPADRHLIDLLLMADAAHRAGAVRITAVVPYFGYARQDRRGSPGEPVAARVVADMLGASPIDRVVSVDLHTPAIEGFLSVPLEALTAVPLLAENVAKLSVASPVIVAPDLGAVKLAERYASLLDAPVAVVHKARVSGSMVRVTRITGDVTRRAPIIVDDMISTGGTIEAATASVLGAGCLADVTVVATHGLFVGSGHERLRKLPLRRIVVTDSVPLVIPSGLPMEVVSLAPLLARTIEELHSDQPTEASLVKPMAPEDA
jgi:ribose-phosphate pyrophosphokinase